MKPGGDSPARRALQGIARGAGRSRLGDRLPEDKRPSRDLMISIGLASPEEGSGEMEMDDEEDEV